MENKFTIILLFLFNVLYSQSIQLNGKVKDSKTNEIIPYVNITYSNINIGTISDVNGNFKIEKSTTDSLITFSSIAHYSKIINIRDLQNDVYLEPKTEVLEEILISKKSQIKFNKNIDLGPKQNLKIRTALPIGYEFASYIENKYKKEGIVKEVVLNLNKRKDYDLIVSYKIKFYEYDKVKKEPSDLLYFENIIIKPENRTYKLKINVEELGITLPETGICIGVEILNLEDYQINTMSKIAPLINFTHTENKVLTWSRFMDKKWYIRTNKSKAIKNKYINANINITAKI